MLVQTSDYYAAGRKLAECDLTKPPPATTFLGGLSTRHVVEEPRVVVHKLADQILVGDVPDSCNTAKGGSIEAVS